MNILSPRINFEYDFPDCKASKLLICINSSSTNCETVMSEQKKFAKKFLNYFQSVDIVQWNHCAKRAASLDEIKIGRGNDGCPTIPHMFESEPDLILFMSNGVVKDLKDFQERLQNIKLDCPVIVCFTLQQFHKTREQFETHFDMSICEIFSKASQNVAIVLNSKDEEPLLFDGTGVFDSEITIMEKSTVEKIFNFNFSRFFSSNGTNLFSFRVQNINQNFVYIYDTRIFLNLELFAEFQERFMDQNAVFDLSEKDQTKLTFVFRKLYKIMYLAKFDQKKMLKFLNGLYEAMERFENPKETGMLFFKLKMQIALQNEQWIALKKKSLIELEKSVTAPVSVFASAPAPAVTAPGQSLSEPVSLEALAEVRTDKIAKTLESLRLELSEVEKQYKRFRRVNKVLSILRESLVRLQMILSKKLQIKVEKKYNCTEWNALDFKDCIRGECPILAKEDFVGILLQVPIKTKIFLDTESYVSESYVSESYVLEEKNRLFSCLYRKLYINNPLMVDNEMLQILSPGVVSAEFAKGFHDNHPITGNPVTGFVPLSMDIRTFCKNLCNGFGLDVLSFHVLPLYIAMVAKNMYNYQWTCKIVVQHARFLLNNVLVRCRFLRPASSTRKTQQKKHNLQKMSFSARKRLLKAKKFVKTLDESQPVAQDEGVSMYESIEYQLTNYRICLCSVSLEEAKTMLKIATQLMPEFEFPIAKVESYIDLVDSLRQIRQQYVAIPESIVKICTDSSQSVTHRMIAYMCFCDYFLNKSILRCLKFQSFLVAAFEMPLFGPIFEKICNNVCVKDEDMQDLCLKYTPVPSFIDFRAQNYSTQFKEHLLEKFEKQTNTSIFTFEKIDVISNCYEIVKIGKSVTLSILLKRLQQKYGIQNPALYSEIIQQQISIAVSTLGGNKKNEPFSTAAIERKKYRDFKKRMAILKANQ